VPKEEGATGGESYDARMDDEWLGNGLRILRLVDDVFVLDPHHRRGRIGGPMVYRLGKAERVQCGRDPFRYPEETLR